MSGIVGIVSQKPVNQELYDALLLLQHRGQNSAGIGTVEGLQIHLYKHLGLVRDVFHTRHMKELKGTVGVGQCRYPTPLTAANNEESQPFYVCAPYGILLAHDGNITNAESLKEELYDVDLRHINTIGDGEIVLNVLADELGKHCDGKGKFTPDKLFASIREVHKRLQGAFSDCAYIIGKGMVAFRDRYGIRPLCIGMKKFADGTVNYMVASESVAIEGLGYEFLRDIKPGEAVFIDKNQELFSQMCFDETKLNPCVFEYVYIARPDSTLDGINVYAARLKFGEYLGKEVKKKIPLEDIDVVMPIPDSGRPAAQQLAATLNLPYREGFIKNRYVGRTFIMPGQEVRVRTVREKLNPMSMEFKDKNVLLVDDSIVRGTTMREIVRLAREAGARKVYVASTSPRVMFPNFYGIDMPTRDELICGRGMSAEGVAEQLHADCVIYQPQESMLAALHDLNPSIENFECSCFDGVYITGGIDEAYIEKMENKRKNDLKSA